MPGSVVRGSVKPNKEVVKVQMVSAGRMLASGH